MQSLKIREAYYVTIKGLKAPWRVPKALVVSEVLKGQWGGGGLHLLTWPGSVYKGWIPLIDQYLTWGFLSLHGHHGTTD